MIGDANFHFVFRVGGTRSRVSDESGNDDNENNDKRAELLQSAPS